MFPSIKEAVENLYNSDELIRAQAIEVCKKFQTPEYFNWNIFLQFSNFSMHPAYRIFSYKSLMEIIKKNWNFLGIDLKNMISSNFPFLNDSPINGDQLLPTIIDCASCYLTYASSPENIINFFNQFQNFHILFCAPLLATFLESLNTSILPKERNKLFTNSFITKITSFVKIIIIEPLFRCNADSQEFLYLLNLVSIIFQSSAEFIKIVLSDPQTQDFFAGISSFLWQFTNNNSICKIYDSILETGIPFVPIIGQLISTSKFFLENYSALFVPSIPSDINYSQCLFSFLERLPIFFQLLNYVNPETVFLFEIVSHFLHSNSPSVISETASLAGAFFQRYLDSAEFRSAFMNQILLFFQECINLISTQLDQIPGASFDELWNQQVVRSNLFSFVKTLSMYNLPLIVQKIIELILQQTQESPLLDGLIRILSSILHPQLPIQNESKQLSMFLLSIVIHLSPKLQNHAIVLLTKLLPYLIFDQNDLNIYFNHLLTLYISGQCTAFDLLNDYFLKFYGNFSHIGINIPHDQLAQIPSNNVSYYTISKLFFSDTFSLANAIEELQWFTTSFNFHDPEHQIRLNQTISRAFDFISTIQTVLDPNIITLLFESNNVIIRIINNIDNENQSSKLITPLQNLSKSILYITSNNIYISYIINEINRIEFPNTFFNCTFIWLKTLIIPLLQMLHQYVPNDVSVFSYKICLHFVPLITQIENNVSKKITILICDVTKFLDSNNTIEVLLHCLRANLDDFRVFVSIFKAACCKDLNVLPFLWNDIITIIKDQQQQQYTDFVAEELMEMCKRFGNDINVLKALQGVSEEKVEWLRERIANVSTMKGVKRCFKLFINIQ